MNASASPHTVRRFFAGVTAEDRARGAEELAELARGMIAAGDFSEVLRAIAAAQGEIIEAMATRALESQDGEASSLAANVDRLHEFAAMVAVYEAAAGEHMRCSDALELARNIAAGAEEAQSHDGGLEGYCRRAVAVRLKRGVVVRGAEACARACAEAWRRNR